MMSGSGLKHTKLPLLLFCFAVTSAAEQHLAAVDTERYLHDIQALTASNMEGRGDGSRGLTRAEKLLMERYKGLGLQPKGNKGFLQPFTVITGSVLKGPNHLSTASRSGTASLEIKRDYVPFSFSASGTVSGPLIFAGYGITAEEHKYDDYQGVDAKNGIVLVLRGEPAAFEAGNAGPSTHAELITKAINARNHGAKAILLVNGKIGDGEEDLLTRFGSTSGPEDVGIPFVQVKNAASEKWFEAAGNSLSGAQQQIEAKGAPASFAFPAELRVSLETAIEKKKAVVNNVLAYLPGPATNM